MQQMDAKSFYNWCTGTGVRAYPNELLRYGEDGKQCLIFSEYVISEPIAIHQSFKYPIVFENCRLNDVTVQNEQPYPLKITGGSIQNLKNIGNNNRLTISNVEFKGGCYFAGSIIRQVNISDSIFKNEIIVDIDLILGEFKIERCKVNTIDIKSGKFQHEVIISESEFSSGLFIRDGTFGLNLKLANLKLPQFWIENGTFEALVLLNEVDCTNHFTITGGKFLIALEITGGRYENVSFEGGDFENIKFQGDGGYRYFEVVGGIYRDVYFVDGTFEEITFETFEVKGEVHFRGGEYSFIEFDMGFGARNKFFFDPFRNEALKVQTLAINQNWSSYINISNGTFGTLEFGESILGKDASIQISDVKFYGIIFENYNNHGYINFNGVGSTKGLFTPTDKDYISASSAEVGQKSQFSIVNSSLGKLEFIGCNLAGFEEFIFENSKILDVFIAGTKMPKTLTITDPEDRIKLYTQQRLGYGQLKKIFEARGEQADAMHYHSEQMEALKKTFTWKKNWAEIIVLTLNNISNEHGTNWVRALGFTMVVSITLFTIYAYLLFAEAGKPYWDFSALGWHNFCQLAGHYFDFLLPIHKSGFMEETFGKEHPLKDNIGSYFVDFLGRVFISYGISLALRY